jgi:hypothetical protein
LVEIDKGKTILSVVRLANKIVVNFSVLCRMMMGIPYDVFSFYVQEYTTISHLVDLIKEIVGIKRVDDRFDLFGRIDRNKEKDIFEFVELRRNELALRLRDESASPDLYFNFKVVPGKEDNSFLGSSISGYLYTFNKANIKKRRFFALKGTSLFRYKSCGENEKVNEIRDIHNCIISLKTLDAVAGSIKLNIFQRSLAGLDNTSKVIEIISNQSRYVVWSDSPMQLINWYRSLITCNQLELQTPFSFTSRRSLENKQSFETVLVKEQQLYDINIHLNLLLKRVEVFEGITDNFVYFGTLQDLFEISRRFILLILDYAEDKAVITAGIYDILTLFQSMIPEIKENVNRGKKRDKTSRIKQDLRHICEKCVHVVSLIKKKDDLDNDTKSEEAHNKEVIKRLNKSITKLDIFQCGYWTNFYNAWRMSTVLTQGSSTSSLEFPSSNNVSEESIEKLENDATAQPPNKNYFIFHH